MSEKLCVTIFEENAIGKICSHDLEVDSMVDCARYLITYRPKKGYRVVNVNIDVVEVLV